MTFSLIYLCDPLRTMDRYSELPSNGIEVVPTSAGMQQHHMRPMAALEIVRAHAFDIEEFAFKPAHHPPPALRATPHQVRGRLSPVTTGEKNEIGNHWAATAMGSGWRKVFRRG